MELLKNIDLTCFYFFNHTLHNKLLNEVVPVITNHFFVFIFLVGLAFLFFKKNKEKETGILILAGMTVSHYFKELIKELVKRPRPFHVLNDVNVLVDAKNYSFPSGHSAAAFMFAYILYKRYGKGYIFFTFAAIIAFSRPYVGVHYPSDILTGAILGTLIGYFLCKVVK